MGKKKSLGSTPIGYRSNSTSYSFIRDIGMGKDRTSNQSNKSSNGNEQSTSSDNEEVQTTSLVLEKQKKEPAEKMVVSYYLETTLVDRLKIMADEKESYYSTVVSRAIRTWLSHHGF